MGRTMPKVKNDSGPEERLTLLTRLLREVANGRLSPEEADAEALTAGRGSLSRLIPPSDDWPSGKPFWTVPMVLAWITWRTYAEVREWDREYLSRRREWGRMGDGEAAPRGGDRYRLFRRKPPNSQQFQAWGDHRFGPWVPIREPARPSEAKPEPAVLQALEAGYAKGSLMTALREGRLVCLAQPRVGKSRLAVPPSDLVDLELSVDASDKDMLCRRDKPSVVEYSDPVFSRPAVLGLWPAHLRSDLDEWEDFEISPMVDDLNVREALYSAVSAHEIEADGGGDAGPKRGIQWTDKHLAELKSLNEALVSSGKEPMTIAATVQWARTKGISREGAREMRGELPDSLKRRAGRTAPKN